MVKAIRKSDGKQIEVREWRGASDVVYATLDMNEFYQESDLDFLPEKETAVLEGWVARDMDGGLFLYPFKPYRESAWFAIPKGVEYNAAMQIDKSLFPSVTWQSEPKRVRIRIEVIE